eukprot:TRINITY_DN493_c0_g3_i1.p1 TRINITY_DN493_c0_g3~~TRINITY_DN493_c0_g3_i1.p1  ORF type:complete len:2040 (-),score=911.87 TRINITY_DN493_c0_g3_i1:136-6255(-)
MSRRYTSPPLQGLPRFYKGEAPLAQLDKGVALFNDKGKIIAEGGSMWITNFRTLYRFYEIGEVFIAHTNIVRLEKGGKTKDYELLAFHCRSFQSETFGFKVATKFLKTALKHIEKHMAPKAADKLFCFSFQGDSYQADGWKLYDIKQEFQRQGIDKTRWRISTSNQTFGVCVTYPRHFVICSGVEEAGVYSLSVCRKAGRIPVLTWTNSKGAALLRASVLLAMESDTIGLADAMTSEDDQKYIRSLLGINPEFKPVVIDMGESQTATGLYTGPYAECELIHMSLVPHTEMQRALDALRAYAVSSDVFDGGEWLEHADETKWSHVVSRMLLSAAEIASYLTRDSRVVMVQNYNGGNEVAVACFLAQVLSDPFYRTIRGLGVLIEKEFLSFGFRFGTFVKRKPGDDVHSTMFVLALDCLFQIMTQNPLAFEYSDELLLEIMSSVHSCQYGTFAFISENARVAQKVPERTQSLWSFVLSNETEFMNPCYIEYPLELHVNGNVSLYRPWNSYFLAAKLNGVLSKAARMLGTAVKKNFPLLELNRVHLPHLPFGVDYCELKRLQDLNLSGNLLPGVPQEILLLTALETLNMSSNMIAILPSSLLSAVANRLHNLRELNFDDNRLHELPVEVGEVVSLERLRLNGNCLKALPSLASLSRLSLLDLGNNELDRLPQEVLTFSSLTYLDVGGNKLSHFPAGLRTLSLLETLNFAHNELTEMPAGIGELANLRGLSIGGNHISPIPGHVLTITNLTQLSVANMSLQDLPDEVGQLRLLEHLDASHNEMSTISEQVISLVNLRTLNFANNKLVAMPLDIANLTQLTELHLEDNQLEGISPGLGKLHTVRYLNVSNNRIRHVPATIGFMKGLLQTKNFFFHDNPKLKTPSKEVIARGFESVMTYLQAMLHGYKRCYRMKVMVVGQENVGKTSLLRCLTKKTHLDEDLKKATNLDSVSTDGIDIGGFQFRHHFPPDDDEEGDQSDESDEEEAAVPDHADAAASSTSSAPGGKGAKLDPVVDLSIWDFAGQEIYYTTHQFFLSNRAVYVLAWNMAKQEEDSRVEYWLKSIDTRAPNAPIIIVGTHLDDKVCTPEYVESLMETIETKYMKRFPNIQTVLPVSCSNKKGIKDLMLWLQAVVVDQPAMGEKIPLKYLELEKLCSSQGRILTPPTRTWEGFEAMAEMCQIRKPEMVRNASQLLHDLGSIVHFSQEKALSDMVILNPQWLVDVMSTVVTTKHQYTRQGVLLHQNLPQIWRAPDFPPSLHSTLLYLLEKFEISYYLRATQTVKGDVYSGKSLIPSLLPEERPSDLEATFPRFPRPKDQQFGRFIQFAFIPHGFVSRLMVRLLHFTDEPLVFWRFGILLEKDGQVILVEAHPASKRLYVTLRGAGSGKLSQLVLETINALIDGWYKVNVEVYVPCIHCVRDRMYDPYLFTLAQCEEAAIAGQSFVKCGGVRDIRLDTLTPDIAMTHVAKCKLNFHEIEMGKKIGEGGFADVFKSTFKGEVVAVKKIKFGASNEPSLDSTTELEAFGEFRREVWIMSGIVHENCVRLTGFSMDPFCIVSEFLACGNLYDLIHKEDFDMTDAFRWRCAMDMAKGMAFLHGTSPPIIHRDLKSPNVLLAALEADAEVVAKIADFGLSQALASTTSGRSVANPVWLAPEIMNNDEYTEKADVYSYGVMLWELYTREDFFGEISFMSALENKVIEGQRPAIPDHCPAEYRHLIETCWSGNPEERPSFVEIKKEIAAAIKQYAPSIYETAVAEKSQEELCPTRDPTAEELEVIAQREREEAELAAREEAQKRATEKELELCCRALKPEHTSSVQSMAYCPETAAVWVGTSSGQISVWDASKCEKQGQFDAHEGRVYALREAHGMMWSSGADKMVRMWAPRSMGGKPKKETKGEVLCLARVGKTVWGGTSESYALVLDGKACKVKKKIKVVDHGPVYCILWLESQNVAWAGIDGRIARINVKASKVIDYLESHTKSVNSMIAVGNYVWSASSDKTLRVWHMEEGDCLKILQGHTGPVFGLVHSNLHVWSGSWDKTLMAWDAEVCFF